MKGSILAAIAAISFASISARAAGSCDQSGEHSADANSGQQVCLCWGYYQSCTASCDDPDVSREDVDSNNVCDVAKDLAEAQSAICPEGCNDLYENPTRTTPNGNSCNAKRKWWCEVQPSRVVVPGEPASPTRVQRVDAFWTEN